MSATTATAGAGRRTGARKTAAKAIGSALRILKAVLLCVVVIAPVAHILATPGPAINCAAGCQDV